MKLSKVTFFELRSIELETKLIQLEYESKIKALLERKKAIMNKAGLDPSKHYNADPLTFEIKEQ